MPKRLDQPVCTHERQTTTHDDADTSNCVPKPYHDVSVCASCHNLSIIQGYDSPNAHEFNLHILTIRLFEPSTQLETLVVLPLIKLVRKRNLRLVVLRQQPNLIQNPRQRPSCIRTPGKSK